jgi:hypothetical protein
VDESAEPVSALDGGRWWVEDPQLPAQRIAVNPET